MNSVGKIPSPYGVMIDVYEPDPECTDPEHRYTHDLEGCMSLAGVHGVESRAACLAALRTRLQSQKPVTFDIFEAFGGRKVPKVSLPRPVKSAYAELRAIAGDGEARNPVENWISLVLATSDWSQRAAQMLDALAQARKASKGWTIPSEVSSFATAVAMTSAMEHLAEPEIDCIEAAAFYAASSHSEWRSAGQRWLEPMQRTWHADWIRTRPAYRRHVNDCRILMQDLPRWLSGKAVSQ